jgi:regulator of cell morphogenesis and NO signaling
MNESSLETATVGEIVASDFRAADVFDRFGIDYCCGGRRSLADACRAASTDLALVERELNTLPALVASDEDVTNWAPGRLVDHIVVTHHAYVRNALPTIERYLAKLVAAHGERHPELARVLTTFSELGRELGEHMFKEERVLFPYIAELAASRGQRPIASPFGTVRNPIRMMEREHIEAGDHLHVLRELTGGYRVPGDGCATYSVAMSELRHFERDLHRHIHLENNVLFPKAVELEHGSRLA